MTEHPPEARKPGSKRIYILWGVALAVLLTSCGPYRLPSDPEKRYDRLWALCYEQNKPQCVPAVRGLLEKLLAEPRWEEGCTRIMAIKVLVKYRAHQAVPLLLKALDDPYARTRTEGAEGHAHKSVESVAGRAADALYELTAGKIGQRQGSAFGHRREIAKKAPAWRAWWRENGAEFLKKIRAAEQMDRK